MKSKKIFLFVIAFFCFCNINAQTIYTNFNLLIISPINQIENSPKSKGDIIYKINAVSSSKTKIQNSIAWSPIKHIALNGNCDLGFETQSFSVSTGFYGVINSTDNIKQKVISLNVGYNYCPVVNHNFGYLLSFTGKYNRLFLQTNLQSFSEKSTFLIGVSAHGYDWKEIIYESESDPQLIREILSVDPLYAINSHIKYGFRYSKFTIEFGLNYLIRENSPKIDYYRLNVTSGFSVDLN